MHDPRRDQRVAATCAVALPAVSALAWPGADAGRTEVGLAVAVAVVGLIGTAALWLGRGAQGRAFLTVAGICAAAASTLAHADQPAAVMLAVLGIGTLLVHAHGWLAPAPVELGPHFVARWSTPAAAALIVAAAALRVARDVPFPAVAAAVGAVPLLATVEADRRRGDVTDRVAVLTAVCGGLALASFASPAMTGPGWGGLVAAPVALAAWFRRVDGRGLAEALFASPARLLVASFVGISLWGTALLAGGPSGAGRPLAVIDAAFTAVSATCVNGLVVIDPASDLTWFGQAVVLILIQVGGLGIMTFAAAAWIWTGRRMSLREEATAADLLGPEARGDLEGALSLALRVTLAIELATAAVLVVCFVGHGDDPLTAAWRALFTAVSAFCNAGFALQPDSLAPYRGDPMVLATVGAAAVAGSLGPGVIAAIPAVLRGRGSLHAQVALSVTLVLLTVPSVLYALLEWNASLGPLSAPAKVLNACFQVVSPRSVGFTTVDLAGIQAPTWTLLCVLMFVGGTPGSTAGGVKTTAVAAVGAAAVAAVRGQEHAVMFGRRLSHGVVLQALASISVGLVAVVAALLALQLTQDLPLDVALFETVSALGTVGLSIGGTAQLDAVGKVIVMACMLAGRVGPLTVVVLLAERRPGRTPARPEGVLLVG